MGMRDGGRFVLPYTCEQLRRALFPKKARFGRRVLFFLHIARLYMHGARYESARLFFNVSHAMRNKSVGFESTRVFMHGA